MNEQERDGSSKASRPLTRVPSCAPNPILLLDQEGRTRWANTPAREQLAQFLEENAELTEELRRRLEPALEEGRVLEELSLGSRLYRVVPFKQSPSGETLLFWHETTIRRLYRQIAALSEHIMEHSLEAIVIADSSGLIELVNPAFSRITGYSPEEVAGRSPKLLRSHHQEQEFYDRMWREIANTGMWRGELWNRRKNGEAVYVWECIMRVGSAEEGDGKYLALFYELGEPAEAEDRLFRHSYFDALSGLPNRQLFFDRLSRAIASAKREEETIGVLLLDVDNFKKINDSLGHRLGDTYLQIIAERLRSVCREEDTIGRLGGDEFGIINLRLGSQNHALEILERLGEALRQPVLLGEHELVPSASIGVTFYPEDGGSSETLLKNADLAMYQAKTSNRGGYAFFNAELHHRAQQRISLESSLRRALDTGEFRLHYQPKVRAADDTVVGAEALVRWNRRGELVSPADFIPVAEEMGLIFPLGRYIFTEACRSLLTLQEKNGKDFRLSVNVSGEQFRDPALVEQLASILRDTGADPAGIVIEITENVAISDIDSTLHMMHELDALGIRVSIDDFGTGYSSLAYIKGFTAEELKIDRSFIRDLPGNPGDRAIVKAVISMAHELGMIVTAEGVELAAQRDLLHYLQCDYLQGYYYSPPLPLEDFSALTAGEGQRY